MLRYTISGIIFFIREISAELFILLLIDLATWQVAGLFSSHNQCRNLWRKGFWEWWTHGSWTSIVASLGIMRFLNGYGFMLYFFQTLLFDWVYSISCLSHLLTLSWYCWRHLMLLRIFSRPWLNALTVVGDGLVKLSKKDFTCKYTHSIIVNNSIIVVTKFKSHCHSTKPFKPAAA